MGKKSKGKKSKGNKSKGKKSKGKNRKNEKLGKTRKKILWICDSFLENTGYSNMSAKLCQALSSRFDVINFFINTCHLKQVMNEGQYIIEIPRDVVTEGSRDIVQNVDSDIKNYYCDLLSGYHKLPEILQKENPDIVVSMNDYQIIKKHMLIVQTILPDCKFIPYMPVDSDYYMRDFFDELNKADCVITMNQTSVKLLAKDCKKKIYVLPHFIDQKYKKIISVQRENDIKLGKNIQDIDVMDYVVNKKQGARDKIFGKNKIPEMFKVVLNINNSDTRKRLDLYIESLYALNRKIFPDDSNRVNVMYVLKTSKNYNLEEKIKEMDDKYNLNMGDHFIHLSEKLNTEQMNLLYNSADVFVTTTSGEGFGLTPFEAVGAGVFTLVPDNTCYSEYFPKELLIDCGEKSLSEGRNRQMMPTQDIQNILIQGIPSYTMTTVKYLDSDKSIENFTCRKIIIDEETFETQLNFITKERTPFQMVLNVDVTKGFENVEKIFNKYKKINFEKFFRWNFTLVGKESYDAHIVKVKIVKMDNLVEKLIYYFRNPEKCAAHVRDFNERISAELSVDTIQKILMDLPCFTPFKL